MIGNGDYPQKACRLSRMITKKIHKEGRIVKKTNAGKNKGRMILQLSTALLFTLFTAYQVYLLVVLKTNWENRVGRLSGIILFIFISVSTVFAIIPRPVFRVLSSVLLIVGLSLNIIFKLTNAVAVFERLNFAVIPSVLNCAVYVGSQVAAFVLLLYFVVFRRREKVGAKRILDVFCDRAVCCMPGFGVHFADQIPYIYRFGLKEYRSQQILLLFRLYRYGGRFYAAKNGTRCFRFGAIL